MWKNTYSWVGRINRIKISALHPKGIIMKFQEFGIFNN